MRIAKNKAQGLIQTKCGVHLGRISGGPNGDCFSFQLTDTGSWSGVEFYLSFADFGKLVSGMVIDGIDANFHFPENLGLQRVRKTSKVYLKKDMDYEGRDAFVERLGRAREKDGWTFCGPQGSWSQGDTGYDSERKKHWVRIHFHKYVSK